MKNSFIILTLCSAVLLGGCSSNNIDYISHPETADQIQNVNTAPSENEIAKAYYKAIEAFSWFHIESLAYQETESNDNVESIQSDGEKFYKIDIVNLETYNDLQRYLRALFSEDIVQDLLIPGENKAKYKDINGQLFGTIYARVGNSSKGKQECDIIKVDENKFTFKVIVHLLDDDMNETDKTEIHEFNYEYINGKWVFTNFYLFL